MLIEQIKLIIYKLFGKKASQTDEQLKNNEIYAINYEDNKNINFTAIFANKLASLATTNSEINVIGNNKRADKLQEKISDVWAKIKHITAGALGYGGVLIVPYTKNGEIYNDIVPQHRFCINKMCGEKITQITIIADVITRDNNKYIHWIDYELKDGTCVIRNKATVNDREISLKSVPEFEKIQEEIVIPGCDRLILSYLKCPIDNRNPDDFNGVPITYGSEKIIKDIHDTLEEIRKEYRLKQTFVGVDDALQDENGNLPENGLFKKFRVGGTLESGPFFEPYSPDIRYEAYTERLTQLYELLEKSIGVNKGILTEPKAIGNTATEINRASYDTFALASDIRKSIEKMMEDLAYAFDVLLNYFGDRTQGDYRIKIEWDYKLLEDSSESFNQIMQAVSIGAASPARLNAYVFDQTLEEAEEEIRNIGNREEIIV